MGGGGSKTEPKENSDSAGDSTDDVPSKEKKKTGEPTKYDPTFNGPIKNRSCTDIICCILFILCFLVMVCIAGWAYWKGNPETLLYPTDSYGNICGSGDYETKPNLFFFDLVACAQVGPAIISSGCPTTQICVETCPSENWVYLTEITMLASAATADDNLFCTYTTEAAIDDGTNAQTLQELVSAEECASYTMDSEPLVGRCIPSLITQLAESILDANGTSLVNAAGEAINGTVLNDADWMIELLNIQSYGAQILADVEASWWLILIMLAVGMVVSFLMILIMRCIAGPIVWISLFLFLVGFTFTTYYCFNEYVTLKDTSSNATTVDSVTDLEWTTDISYYTNLYQTWLVLGILSAIVLFVVLIILIFLRGRIRIAIELINESSRAVGNMPFTLLWPLWPFVFEIALFGFWGANVIYLASVGTASYGVSNATNVTVMTTYVDANGDTVTEQVVTTVYEAIDAVCNDNSTGSEICSFIAYGGDEYTIYMQIFQLFMLFWCMNFIIAVGQMTLAGAFASYYWAFDKKKDIPVFPLLGALWRTFRYHLGTVAFGSLIIALIQLIRVGLEYLDRKLKQEGCNNAFAKFLMCCLKCFFWCLEKFMKFINKNAYILCAVYGKNFCTSAKNAFFLILRNIVRVVVLDKVTDFLLLISKLVVVALVGSFSFFWFDGTIAASIPIEDLSNFVANYTPTLNFYITPVVIIIVGTYIIASAFFSVYSMAVDTLFLCFLEDLERHDGSAEKPYFMSKGLMSILGLKNKPPPGEGDKKKGCCGCC